MRRNDQRHVIMLLWVTNIENDFAVWVKALHAFRTEVFLRAEPNPVYTRLDRIGGDKPLRAPVWPTEASTQNFTARGVRRLPKEQNTHTCGGAPAGRVQHMRCQWATFAWRHRTSVFGVLARRSFLCEDSASSTSIASVGRNAINSFEIHTMKNDDAMNIGTVFSVQYDIQYDTVQCVSR